MFYNRIGAVHNNENWELDLDRMVISHPRFRTKVDSIDWQGYTPLIEGRVYLPIFKSLDCSEYARSIIYEIFNVDSSLDRFIDFKTKPARCSSDLIYVEAQLDDLESYYSYFREKLAESLNQKEIETVFEEVERIMECIWQEFKEFESFIREVSKTMRDVEMYQEKVDYLTDLIENHEFEIDIVKDMDCSLCQDKAILSLKIDGENWNLCRTCSRLINDYIDFLVGKQIEHSFYLIDRANKIKELVNEVS